MRKHKALWLAARTAVWLLALSSTGVGQITEATLNGTVRDSSGARVQGAKITAEQQGTALRREAVSNELGEFSLTQLPPGHYQVEVEAKNFGKQVYRDVAVAVGSNPTLAVTLAPAAVQQTVTVKDEGMPIEAVQTTSSTEGHVVQGSDLKEIPLAARSFANIAYLSPMTEPVEPSDPTKARITAVSFAGSSGLNVDLSVDGGDNNDDYIGGFLQNYSPDAMEEFVVRTSQTDADTSHTNGGSVIIASKRGTNQWHGDLAGYFRERALNARNRLDNPAPDPKQPFSRNDGLFAIGGPLVKDKLWVFSSLEYVHENSSVAYNANSVSQFNALAQLAAAGQIPGVNAIAAPTFTAVPFRDTLFDTRFDWAQSDRTQWFLRGSFDLNHTRNDLVQQATLPSTGATTTAHYGAVLLNMQHEFSPTWLGNFTTEASLFDNVKDRNSHLGLALAFPFSATFHTVSGFETFGDNQFITPITAFPIQRQQQKYQFRYDLSHATGSHSPKFGINFIHEPVLAGKLASDAERLVIFPQDPSFYLQKFAQFQNDFAAGSTLVPAGDGSFSQNIQRLGFYGQDAWRVSPSLTINYGLRYDTTYGLFRASGNNQDVNPAVATLKAEGIPLAPGTPHDYRGAVAPRLGIAYAPGGSNSTVIRAGIGMYYNDLLQNGWVNAFNAVNRANALPSPNNVAPSQILLPGAQGFLIDPHYKTPYALQASAGVEHSFNSQWLMNIHYEHQQGVHQYRQYQYTSGVTLTAPASAAALCSTLETMAGMPFSLANCPPNIALFRSDNRSSYNGIAFLVQHHSDWLDLTAHYTLASATTWGATVGELFDYVNGVSDVRNPFGPGDHGPSGEDVRHRFVLAGTARLPYKFEVSTLAQVESARPYTLATSVDVNNDGIATNDRAVVNGVQTSLDEFRGTPFAQVDMRVSRSFKAGEHVNILPFAEFFNLFNRQNPGNNFVGNITALPLAANDPNNTTALCNGATCTPITSLKQLRFPAGALGDFFGPGTTVGIPFAAQFGVRVSF